jgi:uncharacterized protein (TIGR03086 family)
MREPDVFILAAQSLDRVVEQIKDDQWDMTLPDSFKIRSDPRELTLRILINYHAYDLSWVPETSSGKTMDEVGKEKYEGDLLGDDPKARFVAIVKQACRAAQAITDEQLDAVAHLSFGDFKLREYFWQINMFHGLRAYDIANAIGVDAVLPDELVQGIWDEVSPHAEEWRQMGVFGPKVEVADDAPLLDRLLALTGRIVNTK